MAQADQPRRDYRVVGANSNGAEFWDAASLREVDGEREVSTLSVSVTFERNGNVYKPAIKRRLQVRRIDCVWATSRDLPEAVEFDDAGRAATVPAPFGTEPGFLVDYWVHQVLFQAACVQVPLPQAGAPNLPSTSAALAYAEGFFSRGAGSIPSVPFPPSAEGPLLDHKPRYALDHRGEDGRAVFLDWATHRRQRDRVTIDSLWVLAGPGKYGRTFALRGLAFDCAGGTAEITRSEIWGRRIPPGRGAGPLPAMAAAQSPTLAALLKRACFERKPERGYDSYQSAIESVAGGANP